MTATRPGEPWRIGTSWGIHVYQGEKGSPGERPVATFHDPADAQRAVDAVNGARLGGELREVIEAAYHQKTPRGKERYATPQEIADAVSAWAERRARERAAEEIARLADERTWTTEHDNEVVSACELYEHVARLRGELEPVTYDFPPADDRPAT